MWFYSLFVQLFQFTSDKGNKQWQNIELKNVEKVMNSL